ncbi:MAG: flagellar hook-associated protein FlgK [Ignavibacteriaceae bacterium]
MAISRTLNIAESGLQVYQQALDVTSNNISNSSNTNYSREVVNLDSATPTSSAGTIWGNGVTLKSVQAVRDTLTIGQIITNNSAYSYNNQLSTELGDVQSLFNEPSTDTTSSTTSVSNTTDSLSNSTSAFFTAWQNLASTPNSVSLRNNVIQAAQSLSNNISTINTGISTVKTNTSNEIDGDITTLNSDLTQIQSLNAQICAANAAGETPNDLVDTRLSLINSISNLTNVSVSYSNAGAAVLSIGGVLAVDQNTYNQFSATEVNGKLTINSSGSSSPVNLSGGGTIGAEVDTYNTYIPEYQTSLNNYVNRLMTSVNDLHETGYSITNPTQNGTAFFSNYADGVLSINPSLVNDPNSIAVSSDGTSGNGDIATSIADLANKENSSGTTLTDDYSSLVSKIGTDTQNATNQSDNYSTLLTSLNNQESSYSGVSLDEEMTNVINYQRSYQACAEVISTASNMLETLINMMGGS